MANHEIYCGCADCVQWKNTVFTEHVDSQIDDLLKMMEAIEKYQAQRADNVRVQDEVRREIEEKRLAQLERERTDELYQSELQRRSGC